MEFTESIVQGVLPEIIVKQRSVLTSAGAVGSLTEAEIVDPFSDTKIKTNYFRVSRLVVLPDYQGIGIGKRLLNFVAELYTSQINLPFYLVTSNPQLIRSNLESWKIKRFGHGSHGRENTRINKELVNSNSRRRLTFL
jgi:GNAT superfamily N-acetyltransferase